MADVVFTRRREYKDLSLSFGRNPVTSDVIAVTSEEAVKRSIKNLLNTMAGEVPFFPNFGTRLHRLLFEPIDAFTTARLENEIRLTIEGYEPRVRLQRVAVTPTADENKYQIDLVFYLVNLATPVTLTLFLARLR